MFGRSGQPMPGPSDLVLECGSVVTFLFRAAGFEVGGSKHQFYCSIPVP